MNRPLVVSIIILPLLSALIFIAHYDIKEYVVEKGNDNSRLIIHQGDFEVACNLRKQGKENLIIGTWFSKIKAPIKIISLELIVEPSYLVKIEPYSGMHPWDIEEYINFSSIPDSLKSFDVSYTPYYTFDHHFNLTKDLTKIKLGLIGLVQVNESIIDLDSEFDLEIIEKREFRAWGHGDITVLLIPLFLIIASILLIIQVILYLRKP
jgi:hypothetical protein